MISKDKHQTKTSKTFSSVDITRYKNVIQKKTMKKFKNYNRKN